MVTEIEVQFQNEIGGLDFFVKMRSPYHIAESPVICSLFTRLASFSSALNCIERPMTPTSL